MYKRSSDQDEKNNGKSAKRVNEIIDDNDGDGDGEKHMDVNKSHQSTHLQSMHMHSNKVHDNIIDNNIINSNSNVNTACTVNCNVCV